MGVDRTRLIFNNLAKDWIPPYSKIFVIPGCFRNTSPDVSGTIPRMRRNTHTDITYIPMKAGFLYLTAVIDWYSRYVLAWKISNSLDGIFCREVLLEALNKYGKPEIFNTDQGCQYTSLEFVKILQEAGIAISMDGRGRALDNIFIERLWRTVKQEYVYLHEQSDGMGLYRGLSVYFLYYNTERLHSSLSYKTPRTIYFGEEK